MSSLEFYNEVIKVQDKIRVKTQKNITSQKNHLGDNINEDILMKLEEMRRSH